MSFINDNFLLQNSFSEKLYHEYVRDLPIIDYHNHLPPKDIAENRIFQNLSQVWLEGDHYKWRALRAQGVDEKYITGDASDKEKFLKWAETVPYTVRNPLYHWTHLELKRYFNIDDLLTLENAEEVYRECSNRLQETPYHTIGLLTQRKVEFLGTTDDPVDTLIYHKIIDENNDAPKTLPTFRPDKAYAVENISTYLDYLDLLSNVSQIEIKTYDDLISALDNRITYFHDVGCRIADHGLEQLYEVDKKSGDCNVIFNKIKSRKNLSKEEVKTFKSTTLLLLCRRYHAKGWVQQFHLGAIRNNNTRLLDKLGSDTGFDSMGDFSQAKALSSFLNNLDSTNQLSKTILYNLNPAYNEVFATMAGNFNDGTVKGKVQYGSAWWFLDQKDGMEKQINTLSNMGLLSSFVGMLTDSRSFLSFPRHEYFRRILCNLIGQDVENGELPADEKWLGKIVSDICYYNAKAYFGL
ncbi:uronate isomerase [Croceivirga lutea]|uniref:glucuronate isomerase n=1 Tax=Croceivirga lutea TaxID=1775167 RepID=UPI001639E0B2|nr:glucuronate isomerase [Croceivirga lutea]GGG50723.1 uronate isomerase [Croceivirga lutea]